MKIVCTNIDWDIEDEDLEENFGGTVDKNGLPYTAKDLGLPAWDDKVVVYIDDDDWNACEDDSEKSDMVCGELSENYGWLVNSCSWEVDDDKGAD